MSTDHRAASSYAADVAHVERETSRVLELAAALPPAAPVPSRPAYTVAALVAHIGEGLQIARSVLEGDVYSDASRPAAPSGPGLVEWTAEGRQSLLEAFRRVPRDKLVTLPYEVRQRPVGDAATSAAIYFGLHRWDLESVLGQHRPLPADIAVAAVDQAFDSYAPRLAGAGVAPIGGTLEFHATDVGAVSWTASVQDGRLAAGRADGTAAPDATVTATAEELALLVLKRRPALPPGEAVSGPRDILRRFLAINYIPDPRRPPH